jgi:uncharacterized UBP type Zn finger protein
MKGYYNPTEIIKKVKNIVDKSNNENFETEILKKTENLNQEIIVKDNSKNNKTKYELNSIIIHEGSATSGHYVCYARPDPLNKADYWLKLNDQSVSESNYNDICQVSYGKKNSEKYNRNAYILFYIKK